MSHATQQFTGDRDEKKHSVLFKMDEDEKDPLFTSVYFMRKAALNKFGVKKLQDIKGIEVTVRILK
jgi:hypothetical protein